jgi:hypothetical protein
MVRQVTTVRVSHSFSPPRAASQKPCIGDEPVQGLKKLSNPKEIKMFKNRSFYLSILITLLVVTACAPQVTVTPAAQAQSEPVTLRLAVADQEGRPSDPYVREFIKQVNTLSNGTITIKPIWDAAPDATDGPGVGVI